MDDDQLPLFGGPTRRIPTFEGDAEAERDEGIARAVDHADRVIPSWSERAYEFLLRYAEIYDQFTCEDLRVLAESANFPLPPDKRAWGHVMLRAARAGVIVGIAFEKAKNPKVHQTVTTLWESKIRSRRSA